MRKPLSPAARLASLLALVLLGSAACATGTGSPVPSAPAAPPSTSTPAVAATPSVTPTAAVKLEPTPIAVLDGEPWIVYSWAPDPGLHLMRPDGSDSHEIAPIYPGLPNTLTGPRTAP